MASYKQHQQPFTCTAFVSQIYFIYYECSYNTYSVQKGSADKVITKIMTTKNMKSSHAHRRIRVPAPEVLQNPRLFKAFSFNNSRPIQGLLPVNHSIAYNATST